MLFSILAFSALALGHTSSNAPRSNAYKLHARQASYNNATVQVDLGYAVYAGYDNASAGLNIFKGIRFAEAPIGDLRWQEPQEPQQNRSGVINATAFAPTCPQSQDSMGVKNVTAVAEPGASEDCLFLNVWAPTNSNGSLPVFLWIHGGGYGAGSGQMDLIPLLTTNNNSFIAITIQYRLGAFGFLSSDEVFRKGTVNAGLLDQHLALTWVQRYIHLFGGDPDRVTIGGESAGAGSVMLQDMAYGGTLGTQLFTNSIAASPYLPMQYAYNDWIPSQSYYAFAMAAGCMDLAYLHNGSQPIFECLVSQNTSTLINASQIVSAQGSYGTWAFLPVTDGIFVQDLPSRQLARGAVNGKNVLSGNNADEGWLFVDQDIKTEADLVAWIRVTFPLFSENDIARLLYYYRPSNSSASTPEFATEGNYGATALNESSTGVGYQETANLIYGETTFICPSYWLAEAYSTHGEHVGNSGNGWKYQFSVPPAIHGMDLASYFPGALGPGGPQVPLDFQYAVQKAFGDFIVYSNPSFPSLVANGVSTGNTSSSPASAWPPYSFASPNMLDLNTTCPDPVTITGFGAAAGPFCEGGQNTIRLVNGFTWEAGRGERCDVWKSLGALVPE